MSPRRAQLLFLIGVSAITLHFTIRFGLECARYFSLQNQTKARISQWEIVEIKDRFALKAAYGFESQEKTWQGVHTLRPPYYLNEVAALSALKEKARGNWTVWYHPQNPRISTLEKNFPTGLLIRSAVCYGVLAYFIYLYKRLVNV